MEERIQENKSVLNQRAKQFLKQVKADVDPQVLYCLQLAQWGVEKGGLEIDPRVSDSLPILMLEPPDQFMKKLEGYSQENPEEGYDLLDGLLEGSKSPENLAWAVLDRVRDMLDPILGLSREPTRD